MNDPVDKLVHLATTLPDRLLEELTVATREGPAAITRLRSATGSQPVRAVCSSIQAALPNRSHVELAGVLDGLRRARARGTSRIDVVWSGPSSGVTVHRLTSATVADLINEARREVVLVSYAMHSEPSVGTALEAASARSVDITLLAERAADNPRFDGGAPAFSGIPATRLAWPGACREDGAALHAKVLVIDEQTVLIGSANLTQYAMHRNLECGVVIRDRAVGRTVVAHLVGLRGRGVLVALPSSS
ncbi:DISARM system phospholipase D-like protein DrmC [Actinomycetospora sp. CA-101289]|uniref:DISARM system phospholipase D-like protein DrmC n=1 Tax=Actinomycetospora sp. CA-101289 TaxID=3239893 RepID=UPI003D9853CF